MSDTLALCLFLFLQAAVMALEAQASQLSNLHGAIDKKVKMGFQLVGCLQKGAQASREERVKVRVMSTSSFSNARQQHVELLLYLFCLVVWLKLVLCVQTCYGIKTVGAKPTMAYGEVSVSLLRRADVGSFCMGACRPNIKPYRCFPIFVLLSTDRWSRPSLLFRMTQRRLKTRGRLHKSRQVAFGV